ncbi:PASTA domain-containing protein [Micromonospora pattaloongensis]|uniref:PASTA domain-containing protein n=1 Tax=Micromonospora pattaloongensis TaxID=405436 RepID=A0A1H3HYN9_9ACTN|nr:PASTA domain-containing protein [Micromonospora pattaloongensis]SDY20591.1 PASTA domain-containing protein [Micromonospora pattaloongensis]
MTDDRQERRESAQRDAAADRGEVNPGEAPDRTQAFDPFRDDDPTTDDDAERDARPEPGGAPQEPSDPAVAPENPEQTMSLSRGDETAPMPWSDETTQLGRGDETARLPRGDETAPMPRGAETSHLPGGDATRRLSPGAAWAGRAEVPPRTAGPLPGPEPGGWEPLAEDGNRRWWLPILFGLVALLLVGVIGFGVWLILQSRDAGTGPVLPSPSPSTSSAVATTAPAPRPTTAAPTTARPTPSATTAAPAQVPSVIGLPEADARAALDDAGLIYRLEYRGSDQPAGTVIETDPPVGTAVSPGEPVTLVIAVPRTAPGTSGPTASPQPTRTR